MLQITQDYLYNATIGTVVLTNVQHADVTSRPSGSQHFEFSRLLGILLPSCSLPRAYMLRMRLEQTFHSGLRLLRLPPGKVHCTVDLSELVQEERRIKRAKSNPRRRSKNESRFGGAYKKGGLTSIDLGVFPRDLACVAGIFCCRKLRWRRNCHHKQLGAIV